MRKPQHTGRVRDQFGAMDVTKPYKCTWFGDIRGLKPYGVIGFRWQARFGPKPNANEPRANPKCPGLGFWAALVVLNLMLRTGHFEPCVFIDNGSNRPKIVPLGLGWFTNKL